MGRDARRGFIGFRRIDLGVIIAKKKAPPWQHRLGYMIQESFDFLGKWGSYHRENVSVFAVPTLWDRNRRAVYDIKVRGTLVPPAATEELRDYLGRARTLLDNAMFAAVEKYANPKLSENQQRRVYFPIIDDAAKWAGVDASPQMRSLPLEMRNALRDLQPFSTGSDVITWFNKIHNDDKHREPLVLSVIPDPEFVMVFNHLVPPPEESREHWIDWSEPLPAVRNGARLVEYRSLDAIQEAGQETVPIALAIWVAEGWRDVQNLMWDVTEFTTRACAILDDGDTSLADSMKAYFDAAREQLAAFKEMMLTGDKDAETKWMELSGFDPNSDIAPVKSKRTT